MNFLKRWLPFLFGLGVVYLLGYLYEYDFGFSLTVNSFLTEFGHFLVFTIFGFVTCHSFCIEGKLKKPHIVYVLGIILIVSMIGVFNEVRIHPEHGDIANIRDMIFHFSAGITGLVLWRLYKMESGDIV